MRTMFVNPGFFENPRKGRRKGKRRSGRGKRGRRYSRRRGASKNFSGRRRFRARGMIQFRRNAGIAPFVQNPLILSNPRPRRRRRRNPAFMPSMNQVLGHALSYGGGAVAALTTNAVALNRINNKWMRRGAQAAAAFGGGAAIAQRSQALGGAYAGGILYALAQDLAADLLGIGIATGVTAKEADIESLAADLEDVLDEMDDGLAEDGEESLW